MGTKLRWPSLLTIFSAGALVLLAFVVTMVAHELGVTELDRAMELEYLQAL